MTTEQAYKLARVARLRGFHYSRHDLLAEVHFEALKKVTDTVEAEDIHAPLLDRKM
jgi:hypothetical protein